MADLENGKAIAYDSRNKMFVADKHEFLSADDTIDSGEVGKKIFSERLLGTQKVFLLTFRYAKSTIEKNSRKVRKVASNMAMGRPKNEIPRSESLHLRLTKFELEKISRIAEKKEISRTEAILQGIDLLIHHKPKKIASRSIKEILKERGVDTSDLDKLL